MAGTKRMVPTWCQCYKTFFLALLKTRPNKLECLYLAITFHSGLTFPSNTRCLPKKEAFERSSNWVCSGLAFKILRPNWKGFPRANPLAYWASSSVTKEKGFITLTPGVNNLKLFNSSLTTRPNKLNGLPLETLSSQVLEFEGKARANPIGGPSSVCSWCYQQMLNGTGK